MRTFCDFIHVSNITVNKSNHSSICVLVMSYLLLQSSYALSRDSLPASIGMNLTLVKKLQDDDLCQLLECIPKMDKNCNHCSSWYRRDMPHVLGREKKDREHHWWETFLGWSPTARGIFNSMLHSVVILLTLTVMCLLLMIKLYMKVWHILKQLTQLQTFKTYKLVC